MRIAPDPVSIAAIFVRDKEADVCEGEGDGLNKGDGDGELCTLSPKISGDCIGDGKDNLTIAFSDGLGDLIGDLTGDDWGLGVGEAAAEGEGEEEGDELEIGRFTCIKTGLLSVYEEQLAVYRLAFKR